MVLLKIAGMSWQGKSREAASRYASVKLEIRSELGAQNRKNNTSQVHITQSFNFRLFCFRGDVR